MYAYACFLHMHAYSSMRTHTIGLCMQALCMCIVGATGGSTPRPSGLMQKRKMESQPRLGLGIINIVPFVEGLIYY